ncbi:carbohydrate-binding protein [uncultured Aquimarina sp.]|uniref:carbohydrate-binding protein n=1 Tax=uncultured Aquimarina sp. TaxID=575652 RepID=UPI0026317B1A|nr:carbohydrate-binding protein [uncultured Aquimarina sp.]
MIKTNYFINMMKVFILLISLSLSAADITVPLGGNIQDALDDVGSSGGGTVTLASGTFTITSSLKISSNTKLQGSGIYGTTIKTTQNIKMIVQSGSGLKNITIQNLTLTGTNASDGGGIEIISYGADHDTVKISSVRCYKTGWGVHIKGVKNVLVENCDFSENGTAGKEGFAHNMYLRRCYGAIVRNSTFNNSTSANGINISYSEDIEIYNCEMSGNYFRGVRAADTEGYLVHDCIITDNGDFGLGANSENFTTRDIDWKNNCVANNAKDGIYAKSGATGEISNCNSYGNGDDYDVTSAVSQSSNVSDSSETCENPVEPPTCNSHDAFSQIEAEDFCEQSGIQTGSTNSFVGWINNGDSVQYENVDFGSGANSIEISASSGTSGGTIEVRQGSVSGTLLGTVEVTNTGSFTSWETFTASISQVSGAQDIYLVFTGGSGYLLDVDWFRFLEDTTVNPCSSPLAAITPPSNLIGGINYDYYEGSWNSLPNFSSLTPVSSGIASSIDLNNATSTDNFGLRFNGYINILSDGDYTFYTTSDDGSSLWVDGIKIVDNDGLHAAREEYGIICLETGYHQIEVQFFEKTGGNVLSVAYEGPGITKQNISNLYGTSESEGCSIPWTDDDFTISDQMVNYSSGVIDISCASTSLEVSMDIEGIGSMEDADYLNIYYSINGGSPQIISENVNAFSQKTVSVNGITGNTIEIIINGATSVASETYYISNINISEGTSDKIDQTISFGTLPIKQVGDSDFSPDATASSDLSVSYTSSNTNVATIVNGNIHIVSDGISTITASQAGNNTYNAAPNVTRTLTVNPIDNNNTITIQENTIGFCSYDGSIDNNHSGHTGTGFVNTDNALGNGIDWKLDGLAGSYTITWRYTSTSNRSGKLVVDGSTVASNIAFNTTGSWTSWQTESVTVNLSGGVKDVRLEATNSSGLGNIDYMEVTGPNVSALSCTTIGGDCSDFFGGLSITQTNPGCSNNNGQIIINFKDSDAYTQIQLSIDGGNSYPITINDNAGSYSFTGLSNAEYQVAARYAGGDCEYNIAHLILIKDCGDIPLNPGGVSWHDSYEANGFCWCSTNFDHNLGSKKVIVNGTQYSVVDICDELEKHPLFRSRNNGDNIYNDVQCGNGPINDSSDEPLCPGRVDMGVEGCLLRGVRWDMEWLAGRDRFQGNNKSPDGTVKEAPIVYPNPLNNSDLLNITVSGSGLARVEVYNLAGLRIHSESVKGESAALDLQHLNTGVYILKILDNKKTYFSKISIQK